MHFSKTYSQLLLTLPPDLREKAIEYRQLKKLINRVVLELTALGLSPEVLHQVLLASHSHNSPIENTDNKGKRKEEDPTPFNSQSPQETSLPFLPRITYELNTDSDEFEPHLRLWVGSESKFSLGDLSLPASSLPSLPSNPAEDGTAPDPGPSGFSLHPDEGTSSSPTPDLIEPIQSNSSAEGRELIIPLPSDSAFFHELIHANHTLSLFLTSLREQFQGNLDTLSRNISATAKPMSAKSSFHPYSSGTNPATVTIRSPASYFSSSKSDLTAWREVFQLYIESEVFESHVEKTRGERAIEDAEGRLALFLQRLSERGLLDGRRLKLSQSKEAMNMFLGLNASILNLLKFQYATNEATRKILKKHTKRTALPFNSVIPSPFAIPEAHSQPSTALVPVSSRHSTSLALILVQAIGQTIIPIVPDIDDYSCVICSDIAFKPIRLHCGHLFCVRCLVKMQKRGQANCPMCRAPTVLVADRSNVDWALLNFMRDWFPTESKKKLEQNEKEAAKEEMEELGLQVNNCVIG